MTNIEEELTKSKVYYLVNKKGWRLSPPEETMKNKTFLTKEGLLAISIFLTTFGMTIIATDFYKGIIALLIASGLFCLRSLGKYKKIF